MKTTSFASGARSSRLRRFVGLGTCAALGMVAASCDIGSMSEAEGREAAPKPGEAMTIATQPDPNGGKPMQGGVLRYATVSEPTTLDPHTGTSGGDHVSLYPVYDTLLDADPKTLAPEPGLAKSWKFVDDRTLELELVQGVKFHDGTPFDADAVVYNIDRALTLEDSAVLPELTTVKSAEAIDDHVVQLHLTQRDSSLLGVLSDRAGMMVSPKAAEDKEQLDRHPVGTGPFRFVEWQTGKRVRYERNESYWRDGLPYLDGLDIQVMSDVETRVNGLRAGQLDFIDALEPQNMEDLEDDSDIVVSNDPTVLQNMIWWNVSRPPLDDVRVRRALNMAIDREGLWAATMEGTGEPAWMPVPSQHWAYADELVPTFAYDPEIAKELLAEAGYEDGFTLTMTSAPSEAFVRRGEIVQAQLGELGVDVELQPQETVQSVAEYFENKRVDSYNTSMTARADPSITYQTLFSKTSYHNTGAWSPDGFEQLLSKARSAPTQEARAKVFAELDRMIVDQALWVPLVYPSSITARSADVGGFKPSMMAKPNFRDVYLAR